MDFNTLCEIIESAGYSPRSYSGRGMYGEQCVGFVTDTNLLAAMANVIREAIFLDNCTDGEKYRADQLLTQMELGDVKTDSMGLDTIIYFPRVKWAEED